MGLIFIHGENRDSRKIRVHLFIYHRDHCNNTIEEWHLMALATLANASDNPTWDKAMNGPDKAGYWEAATKEFNTLIHTPL